MDEKNQFVVGASQCLSMNRKRSLHVKKNDQKKVSRNDKVKVEICDPLQSEQAVLVEPVNVTEPLLSNEHSEEISYDHKIPENILSVILNNANNTTDEASEVLLTNMAAFAQYLEADEVELNSEIIIFDEYDAEQELTEDENSSVCTSYPELEISSVNSAQRYYMSNTVPQDVDELYASDLQQGEESRGSQWHDEGHPDTIDNENPDMQISESEAAEMAINFPPHFLAAPDLGYLGELPINTSTNSEDLVSLCQYCSKKFSSVKEWTIHMKSTHKNMTTETGPINIPNKQNPIVFHYRCTICRAEFQNKNMLRNHVKQSHTNSRRPNKIYTQNNVRSDTNERNHTDEIHQVPEIGQITEIHMCTLCSKSFTKQSYLDVHYRIIHRGASDVDETSNADVYHCPHCYQGFQLKNFMEQHVKVVHGPEGTPCASCGRVFISAANYERHIRVCEKLKELHKRQHGVAESEPKRIKCPFCYKTLKSRTILERHIQLMHESLRGHLVAVLNKSAGRK